MMINKVACFAKYDDGGQDSEKYYLLNNFFLTSIENNLPKG